MWGTRATPRRPTPTRSGSTTRRGRADEEGGEIGAQSVRLTLLKGWEVAARWRAAVAACDPERHEQLTTTRVHVPGEPEPRVIKQTIPDSFEAMVATAAMDNNHMQKKITVHEHALVWIRNFENERSHKANQRRLEDLLLPGTSALYTAVPSGARMRVGHKALAFRIRQQFGLRAQLGGWHHVEADQLVREICQYHRLRRHDAVVDAIIIAALESNLVACREVAKHFTCPYGTGHSVTPDGAIVLADGTVIAIDVTIISSGEAAAEAIRRKEYGFGSLGALEAARRERTETWERVREAVEDGEMGRREAETARQQAALKVEGAWSGGCKKPVEMGGAIFVPVALTPYGGWHKGAREWTSRTAHTGDSAAFYSWDERFEHPARTWASATHRAFTLQSVAVAMANATYEYVQAESDKAMRQVLGAKASARQETVTPPTAAAGQRDWEQVDCGDDGFDERGDISPE